MTFKPKRMTGQIQMPGEGPKNVTIYINDERPVIVFADQDATPDVLTDHRDTLFETANTLATTITDFDNGRIGQFIDVVIGDALTTVDFTGTNLKSDAGADWSPASGDHMRCVFDGTLWYCDIWDGGGGGGISDGTVDNAALRWNDGSGAWEEVDDVLLVDEATGGLVGRIEFSGNNSTAVSTGVVNVNVSASGSNLLRAHDGAGGTERGFLLTAEYTLSAANRTWEISCYGSGAGANQPLQEWEFDGFVHFHNRRAVITDHPAIYLTAQSGGPDSDRTSQGQIYLDSVTEELWYKFTGNSAVQISGANYTHVRTETTTNIEDITHAINTDGGKVQGVMIYNSTTDQPLWSVGNADGSVWVDATGATAHTPV